MRRLRFAASLAATLDSEFGPQARERRRRVTQRRAQDPTLMLPSLAVMVGPETVPDFAFQQEFRDRVLA